VNHQSDTVMSTRPSPTDPAWQASIIGGRKWERVPYEPMVGEEKVDVQSNTSSTEHSDLRARFRPPPNNETNETKRPETGDGRHEPPVAQ